MASGTITINYNSAWKGYLSYSTTANVSTNKSSVTVSLYMKKDDGYTTGGNGAWPASLTIGSSTKDITTANGYALYQEYACIGSYTKSVSHNSDGTGSVYIGGSVTGPSGTSLSGKTMSGGKTITLDKIPRGSSISATSSVYFGNPCKVTWTPLASTFYYKLKFSLGDWSYTTSAINPGTTSSYSYTGYTIPLNVAEQIPNAISASMSVSLYSYESSSCSTQIGSTSTSSFTVTLPDSVVPTIDSCTLSIDNSSNDTVESWGIALAGYSRIHIEAEASGIYGSTINSFSITGSYRASLTGSALDYTGSIISSSGNKQFAITCTDSRGRTSSVFTSDIIAFTAYTAPKAKKLSMSKNDSGKMVATATWTYDEVGGKNSATAKMYYKTTSAADWTEHSGTMTNQAAFTLTDLTPDELLSYNFKVVVTDALGNSSEKDAFSSTTTVLLDFKAGGDGLGVGKICESEGMEVSMETVFFNEVYIGNRETTLSDYIRSLMKVLSEDMYGDVEASSAIANPEIGQVYFKRVT